MWKRPPPLPCGRWPASTAPLRPQTADACAGRSVASLCRGCPVCCVGVGSSRRRCKRPHAPRKCCRSQRFALAPASGFRRGKCLLLPVGSPHGDRRQPPRYGSWHCDKAHRRVPAAACQCARRCCCHSELTARSQDLMPLVEQDLRMTASEAFPFVPSKDPGGFSGKPWGNQEP